jgi:hypothetical protein
LIRRLTIPTNLFLGDVVSVFLGKAGKEFADKWLLGILLEDDVAVVCDEAVRCVND